MAKVSKNGMKILQLIERQIDTEEAIEKALRMDPEVSARALAALSNAGVIRRQFLRGEMRYMIVQEWQDY